MYHTYTYMYMYMYMYVCMYTTPLYTQTYTLILCQIHDIYIYMYVYIYIIIMTWHIIHYPSARSMCSTRSAIAHSALAFFFFVSGGRDRRQYVDMLGTHYQKVSTLVHLLESHYREYC